MLEKRTPFEIIRDYRNKSQESEDSNNTISNNQFKKKIEKGNNDLIIKLQIS